MGSSVEFSDRRSDLEHLRQQAQRIGTLRREIKELQRQLAEERAMHPTEHELRQRVRHLEGHLARVKFNGKRCEEALRQLQHGPDTLTPDGLRIVINALHPELENKEDEGD